MWQSYKQEGGSLGHFVSLATTLLNDEKVKTQEVVLVRFGGYYEYQFYLFSCLYSLFYFRGVYRPMLVLLCANKYFFCNF